ncbi:hypothetical protein HGA88_04415 [Candidatus Roizmanbacteria bacterium]|nr:hypothetical protein [Candidatus Roizmanbacteria bacterium]
MTLTELSYYSRRMAPLVGIFVVAFIFIYIFLQLTITSLLNSRTVSIVYNPLFGKLKTPYINVASNSSQLSYVLDTVEGEPITATQAAKVYFLPPKTANFAFREKIYLMAKTFGFDTEVVKHKLSGTEASFSDAVQKLTIDVTNFNFTYEYGFKTDDPIFTNTRIPTETEIQTKATDFLNSVGTYPPELAQGKLNIIYLKYDLSTNSMTVVTKPQDANVVEVDMYRPNIDDVPIVSPKFFNSQNYIVMGFNDSGFKILRAQVRFFEKSDTQMGLYPVKTGEMAWNQLKNGQAILVSVPPNIPSISIKKMFLGYLDPDIYQQYLQPVYVFIGDNNFVAYVPAISDQYLTE